MLCKHQKVVDVFEAKHLFFCECFRGKLNDGITLFVVSALKLLWYFSVDFESDAQARMPLFKST